MTNIFDLEIRNSTTISPFIKEEISFGSANCIYLIDQFCGKIPQIIKNNKISNLSKAYPRFLLDSNVVDCLDNLVNNGTKTDGSSKFLSFFARNNWPLDYNFYLLEHFSKTNIDDFKSNSTRRISSILTLESMSPEKYLETEEIILDENKVNILFKQHNVKSINELSQKIITEFINNYDPNNYINRTIRSIEVMLIKMLLIRKEEIHSGSLEDQLDAIKKFIMEDMKIVLAKELHLALHYFSDKAGKLHGTQRSTPIETAKRRIRSTAWDMMLLKLPEIYLTPSMPNEEIDLLFIVTEEKKLKELANLYNIERIKFSNNWCNPLISYNLSNYSNEMQTKLTSIDEELKKIALSNSKTMPNELYESLQKRLESFCSKQ
ncbi:hypothetical protein [Acinetobacter sp. YK3]|uniref:hypothetical protein n=1 Tax=Acinetobacter sp. YK3 TaxID=1860097 RepID=UPI00084C3572|nr:hypothetical protein [Acinetobacter sp. YK3]OEC90080.1 hypothetical protein A9Z07_04950 [Acinetobacter sp. YK3]